MIIHSKLSIERSIGAAIYSMSLRRAGEGERADGGGGSGRREVGKEGRVEGWRAGSEGAERGYTDHLKIQPIARRVVAVYVCVVNRLCTEIGILSPDYLPIITRLTDQ